MSLFQTFHPKLRKRDGLSPAPFMKLAYSSGAWAALDGLYGAGPKAFPKVLWRMVMNDSERERKYPVTGYPSENVLLSLPLGSGLDRREEWYLPLQSPFTPAQGAFPPMCLLAVPREVP